MTYIAPETIEKVRQIDLLTYLRANEPEDIVPIGRDTYQLRSHDSLKISNGLWNWFSHGIGGRSALDYLIIVKGLTFTDAVMKLAGEEFNISVSSFSRKNKPSKTKEKTILLPEKHTDNNRVIQYLEEKRGIDPAIINIFIRRGAIYESEYIDRKSGRTFVNAVFLGFGEKGIVRQASIRGIDSMYKGEASGSDKRYSFSLTSETKKEMLHIFESAIDLMSFLTIKKICHHDIFNCHYISLSGIYRPNNDKKDWRLPLAIERFREKHPEILRAIVHLDNDTAGVLSTEAIVTSLKDAGIEAVSIPPRFGKDVNDELMGIRVREECRSR